MPVHRSLHLGRLAESTPLGLCGPSELTHLVRERCETFAVAHLPASALRSADEMHRDLQRGLARALPVELRALQQACLPDLAELVMSFLDDERFLSRTGNGGVAHATSKSAAVDFYVSSDSKLERIFF